MTRKHILVGILYNAFEPTVDRYEETISERAVETAAVQAAQALAACGYRTRLIPLRRSMTGLIERLRHLRPDALVNLCEGFRGQPRLEAQVAGLLELLDLPFTGNPSRTLALCQDKFRTKAVLTSAGLSTPRAWLMDKEEAFPSSVCFPLIVKPNEEDASLGIYSQSVVRDGQSLRRRVEYVLEHYAQPALVEEFIDGREFNVAIVDLGEPTTLPVSEIEFRDLPDNMPRIVRYEAKWLENHEGYQHTVPVCPALLSEEASSKLQSTALAVYRALKLEGYARVDFRMDSQGQQYILEVNPNPDTSREAGLARSLRAAGIPYEEFWDRQVLLAMNSKEGAYEGTSANKV